MARIIVTLVLLVIVAVFIALNLSYRTTVNIFGWRLEDAPSIIVIIASTILGILLSLSFLFLSFLARRSRKKLRTRIDETRKKEEELEGREKDVANRPAPEETGRPKRK